MSEIERRVRELLDQARHGQNANANLATAESEEPASSYYRGCSDTWSVVSEQLASIAGEG